MLAALASAAAGYLIGTVPCADAAARLATGGTTDLRDALEELGDHGAALEVRHGLSHHLALLQAKGSLD